MFIIPPETIDKLIKKFDHVGKELDKLISYYEIRKAIGEVKHEIK